MKTVFFRQQLEAPDKRRKFWGLSSIVLVVSMIVVQTAVATLITHKISGEMPPWAEVIIPATYFPGQFTYAGSWQLSPNGEHIVFVSDRETDGVFELFRIAPYGEVSPIKLSHEAPADVYKIAITPDSTHVLYWVLPDGQTSLGSYDLYSVPIVGGESVKLMEGVSQLEYYLAITPDSQSVLVLPLEEPRQLYRVPVMGGAPIRMNEELSLWSEIASFHLSPDGQHVLYTADQEEDNTFDLYHVPISGGLPTKLNDISDTGGIGYGISPDSNQVIYAIGDFFSGMDLYSKPITGGTTVHLNPGNPAQQYAISPDSQYVIYNFGDFQTNTAALYTTPIGGGPTYTLDSRNDKERYYFRVSPNSDTVIFSPYSCFKYFCTFDGLSSIPIEGGTAVSLLDASFTEDISFELGRFSPNGQFVLFLYEQGLYSIPASGGTPILLNDPEHQVRQSFPRNAIYQIDSNSQWVVYQTAYTEYNPSDIYSVAITGGSQAPLNDDSISVANFAIDPENEYVVLLGLVEDQGELYIAYDPQIVFEHQTYLPFVR